MNNWHDILIDKRASLRDAMRAIDKGSLKSAFVVNNKNKLLGSITDGDIRRGLLENSHMDQSCSTLMNEDPIFCSFNSSKSERKALLIENDISCIPILKNSIIVGVETLKTVEEEDEKDNVVFIMAGGFGKRLKPLTDNCPKPMLQISQKPILEYLIQSLAKQGFRNIYISTHFLPEIIEDYFLSGSKWGVSIEYVFEKKPLGTGGALSLLPSINDKPIIMVNGDILTDLNFNKLIYFHEKNNFDASMCLRELEHKVSYGVVETDEGKVIGISEKPSFFHNINTGIYVISRECKEGIRKGEYIDMPSYLCSRMAQGKMIGAMNHPSYWIDIGRIDDYQRAQRDFENLNF